MSRVGRFGPGDALIGLALVALVVAALLPTYRAQAFDRMVEEATADVEALRAAASRQREVAGSWPPAAEPGRVPAGVSRAFGGDSLMVRDGYSLEWRLWARIDEVPAPVRPPAPPTELDDDEVPPASTTPTDAPPDSVATEMIRVARTEGAVVVHSGREPLLGELLRRYGEETSFVRDTTWTLVLVDGSAGGGG